MPLGILSTELVIGLDAECVQSAESLRDRPIEISPLYALDQDEFARKTPALPDTTTLLFEPRPSS